MQRSVTFDGFEVPTLGFTSFSEYSLANKNQKRKVVTTEQASFLIVLKHPWVRVKPAPRDKPAHSLFDTHGVVQSFLHHEANL